jgi:hypothetical protein
MKPRSTKEYNRMKKEVLKEVMKKLPRKFTEGNFIDIFQSVEKELGLEIVCSTGFHYLRFNKHLRELENFPKQGSFYLKGE